jgi:hypothetical protein
MQRIDMVERHTGTDSLHINNIIPFGVEIALSGIKD